MEPQIDLARPKSKLHEPPEIDFSNPEVAGRQIMALINSTESSQHYEVCKGINTCGFPEGRTYLLHPGNTVTEFLESIALLLRATPGTTKLADEFRRDRWSVSLPTGIRLPILRSLIERAQCIDVCGREWAAARFAKNPPENACDYIAAVEEYKEHRYQEDGSFSWRDNPFS